VETARKWVGFRVDLEHLQYLSPRTVRWISRECDSELEILDAFGFADLSGIDKMPKSHVRKTWLARNEVLRSVPGLRGAVRSLRLIAGRTREPCDPRLGTYRLFAILRKKVSG
jgi:hypothetical protein